MKIARKMRRKKEKQINKDLNKDIAENSLPDVCLTCEKEFNKKDREMVRSWRVVVNEDRVRLYCPGCWTMAEGIIEKYIKDREDA